MKKLFSFFKLFTDRSGNVTVELALVMGILTVTVLAGYDFSRMMSESHQLDQIARSATQYGIAGENRFQDTASILAAAKAAAGDDAGKITVTQTTFCQCPGGAGAATCGDTCTAGGSAQQYLQVTVTKPFDFLLFGSTQAGQTTLTGTAAMPVT